MGSPSRICPACGAGNDAHAHWCGRCLARFETGVPRSSPPPAPAETAATGAVISMPSLRSKRTAILRLALIAVFLSWKFLDISGASGGYVPGELDQRGFKVLLADAETGEPVRFNVCQPIHYVINPALAPEGGVEDVHQAFEITARAMGANVVYDGTTDEPNGPREAFQPDRYGDRWAPILVSWSDEPLHLESDTSPGSVVGVGGPDLVHNEEGQAVFVSGTVVLDANADLDSGFGGETWGQVMLHELGHVF